MRLCYNKTKVTGLQKADFKNFSQTRNSLDILMEFTIQYLIIVDSTYLLLILSFTDPKTDKTYFKLYNILNQSS